MKNVIEGKGLGLGLGWGGVRFLLFHSELAPTDP